MAQFHFDPDSFLQLMAEEVPDYARLQEETAKATADLASVRRILDLGTGTGETARRVMARHPGAALVGIDSSESMLSRARAMLPDAELHMARLEEPLPAGPFDLVVSALAVHHPPDGPSTSCFAKSLTPCGRAVASYSRMSWSLTIPLTSSLRSMASTTCRAVLMNSWNGSKPQASVLPSLGAVATWRS